MDMQQLHARYEDAKKYKDRWLGLYQSLYNYVLIDRDALNVKYNYEDSGKPQAEKVWDFTAVWAADQHANDVQSLLIPHGRDWGKFVADPFRFAPAEIEKNQPVLDEINANVRFHISQSNLSRVAYGSLLDLVGGTGVVYVESISDEEPLRFRSVPAVSTYFQQNSDDVINSCWFDITMKGYDVMLNFPKMDATLMAYVSASPTKVYTVAYGQIKQPNGMYYMYAFLPEVNPDRPIFEMETSYEKILPFRSKVRPGESEGRGIALDIMPLIEDLNRMVRQDRKGKDLKADPTLFYNAKRVNPHMLRQLSGAMIAKGPGEPNPIEPITMPTYPDIMQHEQLLRNQLIKAFQVDPLGEADSPVKSATEISIRENRAQRYSATNMARIINEFPRRIFETSAKILAERNMITRDGSVFDLDVKKFSFDFQSPLFDIQKQENIDNLAKKFQFIQQFYGEGAVMALSDIAEVNKYLTDNNNLDSNLSKSKEDVNKLMQAMGEMQQQAAMPTPSTQASDVQLPQSTPQQF